MDMYLEGVTFVTPCDVHVISQENSIDIWLTGLFIICDILFYILNNRYISSNKRECVGRVRSKITLHGHKLPSEPFTYRVFL